VKGGLVSRFSFWYDSLRLLQAIRRCCWAVDLQQEERLQKAVPGSNVMINRLMGKVKLHIFRRKLLFLNVHYIFMPYPLPVNKELTFSVLFITFAVKFNK
jgi:hypothetical protein